MRGAIGGGSHPGSLLGSGLIPPWLGVAAACVFAAVLVAHLRHIAGDCPVPRRAWHWGHVLMAASMIVMYLPASLDPLHIPVGGWRAVFIVTLGVLAVCGVNELSRRRAISGLWLVLAGDMIVMLYMWSPGAFTGALSAVLGGFLLGEAGVWACGRGVSLDRPLGPSLYGLAGAGVLGFDGGGGGCGYGGGGGGSVALGATRELRVSMVAMALGMAYMILAMALAA